MRFRAFMQGVGMGSRRIFEVRYSVVISNGAAALAVPSMTVSFGMGIPGLLSRTVR
jgi:hypothetical protein